MNENRIIEIKGKNYKYIHNEKTAKFEKELFEVKAIIEKEELTTADKYRLLAIYRPSYHETGKIEGVTSYDSTATNCEFCELMRKAAEQQKLHICGYCYDYAQEHGFKGVNVLNRHTLNMIIMSCVEFEIEELKVLNASYINRVNSSGDVPNVTYARNMIKLGYAFSSLRFAFWAKNTFAVKQACKELGKPKNMILVQSSCIIGYVPKLEEYFDFVFVVFLTKEAIEEALKSKKCGECNGKKCKACGYKCYTGAWTEEGVNVVCEFLRVTKEKREELING